MSAELICNIPFRASRARFDRPAADMAELLGAQGPDFVHQAAWTLLNRRASREEHADWLVRMEQAAADGDGQGWLIEYLVEHVCAGKPERTPDGLASYLLFRRRRNRRVVPPLLWQLTALQVRYPQLGIPGKLVRSIPGKVRWTYRHARKALLRLARQLQMPTMTEMKHAMGADYGPPPEGTSPAVQERYESLVRAISLRRQQS